MEIGDVPTPTPGPGEVQIRVTAAALNHIDLWLRQGLPPLPVPLPHVSGGDVCGVVAALGPGVAARAGCAVGDRVLVNPGISCGRCVACLGGRDNFCPDYRMIGEQTWGGLAEYLVMPAQNLVPAPRDRVPLDDAQLAALPTVFMTVWQMLVERAQIRQGETVLVLAAGSGIGTAAIQIAKLWGARVIATASTDAKLAAARALGRGRDDQSHDDRAGRRGQAPHRPARRRHRGRARRRRDLPQVGRRLRQGGPHRHLRGDGWVRARPEPAACLLGASSASSARPWPARRVCSSSSTWSLPADCGPSCTR